MIQFDINKRAYENMSIDAIAEVEDEIWEIYCEGIIGVDWDIIDGKFVQLKDVETYLKSKNAKVRIEELKVFLNETDYQAIKYSEGLISDEDYAPIKAQRQAWRDEINELETMI